METYKYLVVSDTNNVIEYIFASSKYRYIRGASLLLDYLNTNEAKEIQQKHGGELLSTGGGEMRVLFTDGEKARAYDEALRKLYIDKTDHVTLTTAVVERLPDERMVDWLTRAEEQLRLNELTTGKKQLHLTTLHPFMKRCESCYNRAAEHEVNSKEQTLVICESCYKKEKQLRKVKEQVEAKGKEQAYSGLSEVHQKLTQDDAKTWVQNIEGLLDEGKTNAKIGFIYADGKRIGSLFKQLDDQAFDNDDEFIKTYKNRSQALHEALINAAVRTHKRLKEDGFDSVPVDYALIGGDDLAAVLPANIATAYAYYLLKYFEEETKKAFNLKKGYELAAGVIIVKKSFPIHKLFDLSYELMDRVKNKHETGMLDFQVVLDSNVTSIEAKRSASPIGKKHLYGEGYSANEQSTRSYKKFHNTIVQLKKASFPGSKIKGVYHITTEENETTLQFKWREWLAHLDRTKDKKLQNILVSWQPSLRETPFTVVEGDEQYTLLRDIFDLYEFIDSEVK